MVIFRVWEFMGLGFRVWFGVWFTNLWGWWGWGRGCGLSCGYRGRDRADNVAICVDNIHRHPIV